MVYSMKDAAGTPKAGRLSRQAWIAAGMAALREGGGQAVRIEALARRLAVSKGSFYWHFRDHAALTAAMLDVWERQSTDQVIETGSGECEDAPARLLRVLFIVAEIDDRLDQAVRGWASADADIAGRVQAVDRRRIGFLQVLFLEMGFDDAVARARARLVYTSMIGEQVVLSTLDTADRKQLATIYHAMLIRPAAETGAIRVQSAPEIGPAVRT